MIKHHNFFKVHLPKKEYKGENENELVDILMEEAHLVSDGKWTKDYEPTNPKIDKFEISLYPSILYAVNKLGFSDQEKFQRINHSIDVGFVDFLERFNPLYKCTSFIEYHLYHYKGEKREFYKHIKYQILTIIKNRKKGKRKNFDYDSLEQIVQDWVDEKMSKQENNSTIFNAKNLIVNQKSKIKNQSIKTDGKEEESNWNKTNVIIALIVGIATIISIIWQIMN